MNQIFRTGKEYFEAIQDYLLHIMYPSSSCPGSHPLHPHLWSWSWKGGWYHAGSSALYAGASPLRPRPSIFLTHLMPQCWWVVFSKHPCMTWKGRGVTTLRGNSQQWDVLLSWLVFGRKSHERYSGHSSEVPRKDGATDAHSCESSSMPFVVFPHMRESRPLKR